MTKYNMLRKNKIITNRTKQTEDKKPKKRHKPTCSHTRKSHKNTALAATIYIQRTCKIKKNEKRFLKSLYTTL